MEDSRAHPTREDPVRAEDDELADAARWVAIRRLQDRYADVITRRAWAELPEVLRADCTITLDLAERTIEIVGPEALADFIGPTMEGFTFFQFVILNTVIEIDHDGRSAGARMFMQEARQARDGRRADTYGVYHDRFVLDDDGRWWFSARRYRTYARTHPPDSADDLTVFELETRPLGGG